jgi:hypothetical protein
MAWSGATTTENEAMNFHKYCVSPKKLLTSVTFVGTGHFMMASIFAGIYLELPSTDHIPQIHQILLRKLTFLEIGQ